MCPSQHFSKLRRRKGSISNVKCPLPQGANDRVAKCTVQSTNILQLNPGLQQVATNITWKPNKHCQEYFKHLTNSKIARIVSINSSATPELRNS
jgi:hypothetical protein